MKMKKAMFNDKNRKNSHIAQKCIYKIVITIKNKKQLH